MKAVLVLAAALAAFSAGFSNIAAAEVTVQEPWARATVPGQPVGAVYMKLSSPTPATLISVETDAASDVQVHTMHKHGGVMRMREHGQLQIPAGKPVELAPGGVHLMLMGLKKPLSAGDTLLLKMQFSDAKGAHRSAVVQVSVRALGQ